MAAAPSELRRANSALFILTGINFLNYLDRYIVGGVLPRIEEAFHLDHAAAGLIGTVFVVVYMLAAPLGGYLGDHGSRSKLIGASVFIWSLATLASGLAPTFLLFLAARGVIGIGEAGYATVSPGLISDLFPRSLRTQKMAVFYVAIPIGSATGFAIGGLLGKLYGWHSVFYAAGLPGVLLALLAARMWEPERGATETVKAPKVPFRDGLRALKTNRVFWVSTFGLTLMTFSIGGLAYWMQTFLETERGMDPARAGLMFGGITALAGTLGTLAGGKLGALAERTSATGGMWVSGLGLVLAAPFMVAVVAFRSEAIIFGGVFCAQFLIFLNMGPLNAAIVNCVSPGFRSFAMGLNVLCFHLLGDAISPPVIGEFGHLYSLGTAIKLNAIPVFVGGLALVIGARLLRNAPELKLSPAEPGEVFH